MPSADTNGHGKGKEKEEDVTAPPLPRSNNSEEPAASRAFSAKNAGKERQRARDLSSLQQLEKQFPIPPRKSSLSLRERRAASNPSHRRISNASSSGAPSVLLPSAMPSDAEDKLKDARNGSVSDASSVIIRRDEKEEEAIERL
jgi:hypothetical protein